jgi:hypothetical protein
MKRVLKYLLVASLLAGALASASSLFAADSTAKAQDKQATEKGKTKRDWYPLYGIVASVDKQANTISLKKKEGSVFLNSTPNQRSKSTASRPC